MEIDKYAGFLSRRQLELIIMPTEQCNFRCTYCYEDFEIGKMKDETVQAIKKLITARLSNPSLSELVFSWFGGEPLMAKDIVYELSEFAQKACATSGIQFSSGMTTNAYGLDSATFDNLLKLNVRSYQISIDGDEDEHNKTRKLISGRGTFAKIWSNLLDLKKSKEQFDVMLRIHIHQENVDSLKQLLPKICSEFADDIRFSIFLKAVGNWGGDGVKQMSLTKNADAVKDDMNACLIEHGWFNLRNSAETSDVVTPCYAARSNSFVIRANGMLNKCTVAFSDPRNSVGHINSDGTLFIQSEKIQPFMRGFQSLDKAALRCPMHGMPKIEEVKTIQFAKSINEVLSEISVA
ncbi:radical SAM protein [Solimicrobium silvestre]|uniref:Radical SAM superfamily n=1 Tax=Solimicrobium silvestre TaxID=2099400 RepID=A0A2S9GYJ2_9BURK|nr:radical SAM protein [Solimicrobium silvestre]PRC92795.1 Radical SAM superfamily [Solimicrobium silvestre]